MSPRACEVVAAGGPVGGHTLAADYRWNDRNVWNVEIDGGTHRYVKKGRSDVAEYEGPARILWSSTPAKYNQPSPGQEPA